MKYCPLMSYHREGWKAVDCFEEQCAFADDCGNCLVQQALMHYVSRERIRLSEEEERIRHETDLAKAYWAMKKNGVRGLYENMTPERDNTPSSEIQLRPPQIDSSYICF